MTYVVFGATGMVGSYIAQQLDLAGKRPLLVSRQSRPGWLKVDLARMDHVSVPSADIMFCATNARMFAQALPALLRSAPKRVVVISSTSVFTKTDSADEQERTSILELIDAAMTEISLRLRTSCAGCGLCRSMETGKAYVSLCTPKIWRVVRSRQQYRPRQPIVLIARQV
jgi:hypothetical protein